MKVNIVQYHTLLGN